MDLFLSAPFAELEIQHPIRDIDVGRVACESDTTFRTTKKIWCTLSGVWKEA